jgi:hypothetical protein
MTPAPPYLPPLTVSVVLYHSDLARLLATLDSLAVAAERAAKRLGPVCLRLRDQSEDNHYHQQLLASLAKRDWAASGIDLAPVDRGENRGYGAGHNALLGNAGEGLCLVLNPDVELCPDALCRALDGFEGYPDAVLICPRGEDGAGQPAHLAKTYPSVLVLALRAVAPAWLRACFRGPLARYARHDLETAEVPQAVVLASGCFMLLRAPALAAVGGFDEDYFLYFEDYDLSLRLADQGTLLYAPAVRIRHHGGESAGKGWSHRAWFLRSAWRFFQSHGWRWWS